MYVKNSELGSSERLISTTVTTKKEIDFKISENLPIYVDNFICKYALKIR